MTERNRPTELHCLTLGTLRTLSALIICGGRSSEHHLCLTGEDVVTSDPLDTAILIRIIDRDNPLIIRKISDMEETVGRSSAILSGDIPFKAIYRPPFGVCFLIGRRL